MPRRTPLVPRRGEASSIMASVLPLLATRNQLPQLARQHQCFGQALGHAKAIGIRNIKHSRNLLIGVLRGRSRRTNSGSRHVQHRKSTGNTKSGRSGSSRIGSNRKKSSGRCSRSTRVTSMFAHRRFSNNVQSYKYPTRMPVNVFVNV